ncbi:MAG: DMT family transporter [bacterium]|nr:DMT family transporter [bacterium]
MQALISLARKLPVSSQLKQVPAPTARHGIRRIDTAASNRRMVGTLALVASTLFIYMASLIVQLAQKNLSISVAEFVFARACTGAIIFLPFVRLRHETIQSLRESTTSIITASLFGLTALYCFYSSLETIALSEATVLNMTSPIFVAFSGLAIHRNKEALVRILPALFAVAGVYLILSPEINLKFSLLTTNGYILGTTSGLAAAISLMMRRRVLTTGNSLTTSLGIFFTLNTLLSLIVFSHQLSLPSQTELHYLIGASLSAIAGQFLINYGMRYVSIEQTSILVTSRIIIAAIIVPFLFATENITTATIIGAFLILGANVIISKMHYISGMDPRIKSKLSPASNLG